ncbi:CinA family protein [Aporhodopirellula aestuarii]|uniref:Nicotinamide-nucleotide amidohydrolase family protein n=1 Tax=Aporhodopirellula aestuarii TaxID=2950107 RepID=A0ABT0U7Q0_9BACT|nr:nicotinamide-nucleotide amidohydrolase family protein [Aporhodopirellula aestuarii]MCM2372973.1 nicotinamide-nucleotide amidohydrolase family protein [Aporhodopirellula aestuarii]
MTVPSVFADASTLVDRFRESGWRLALAESCTCGMAAAMIGRVAGASDVFCGSAVTYRESAKSEWLGVDPGTLRQFAAESRQTTDEMAGCLLRRTSEADWGAAITGHLGPGAPLEIDGHVFVSLANRERGASEGRLVANREFVLASETRIERQIEAAEIMIRWILNETVGRVGS